MSDRGNDPEDHEQAEHRRPRVVDKRISARGDAPEAAPETAAPETPAAPPQAPVEAPPEQTVPAAMESEAIPGGGPAVWTPEQEAEARRIAEEIAQTPSLDWVINTAVTLANVAATKIELGDPADAGLAIDALAALVNSLTGKLAEAEAPLRQTLAQLQMAYAERSGGPPTL
jgi:hypothetical protein